MIPEKGITRTLERERARWREGKVEGTSQRKYHLVTTRPSCASYTRFNETLMNEDSFT